MSGFEVCEAIRADAVTGVDARHPPVGDCGRIRRPVGGVAARRRRVPRRAARSTGAAGDDHGPDPACRHASSASGSTAERLRDAEPGHRRRARREQRSPAVHRGHRGRHRASPAPRPSSSCASASVPSPSPSSDDGNPVTTDIPPSRLDEVLSPAVAGATSLTTTIPEVVDSELAGAAFVDETGEPVGAILVPADVDGAGDEIVPLLAQLSIAISLARANMRGARRRAPHRNGAPAQPAPAGAADVGARRHRHSDIWRRRPRPRSVATSTKPSSSTRRTVGVAIGDVVGHSLHAATVMGELRHALRAYAIDGYGPEEIVERLDRLIRRFHPMMLTTLLYGVVDVTAGELRFCNAGHLPPLRAATRRRRAPTSPPTAACSGSEIDTRHSSSCPSGPVIDWCS